MRRILDVREEEVARFSRAKILDAEVLALSGSGKIDVEPASLFNDYTYGLRSRGWVGQIPIGDDLLLRITPKVPVRNIFRMLEVAYNLQSFRLFDGEVQIESLEDIYERVVSILSQRVLDRVRKGLFRDHLDENDDLPYMRGRVDVISATSNRMRGISRISCHNQEHTADLEDNQILHWTLHQLRRQALRQEKVRIELERARRALGGAITLKHYLPSDCMNRLYHRLNNDYSPMHGLCRFILEHTGPSIDPGDRSFIPFELNMRNLFELFVAEWLRANTPEGITVRRLYNATLDSNLNLKIQIDIDRK